jgi:hypothetical protein
MKANTLFLALSLVFLSSCSKELTSFTRELYEQQNFTDSDLSRIQFFLSTDLVLYRDLDEKGNYQIEDGSVRVKNGKKVQEIIIKQGTPGVFLSRPKSDHFSVAFETGDDSRFLTFGPNPKNGGRYELLASEWNKRTGVVTYANEKFKTYSDAIPRLLVDLKQTRTYDRETSKAKGRRVNQ